MHVQILPEYSAERYFLLSEIEQKAALCFFDEEIVPSAFSDLHAEVVFAYLLFDFSNAPNEDWEAQIVQFMKKIKSTPFFPSQCPNVVIFLEIVIAKAASFEEVRPHVQRLMDSNTIRSLNVTLFAGISDCVAACPALEKCYDVLELSSPGYTDEMMQQLGLLYAEKRDDLKGLDPTHEPDAAKGVFQAFIAPDESSLASIVKTIKRNVSTKNLSAPKESNSLWENPIVAIIIAVVAYLAVRQLKELFRSLS